ncbi:MAG: PAS domain S-box protein [Candidatus Obscuribacterales bacterium]|jgi:PAS domain S-box-containing protein|nr:PAS domain S-box protein [Candidatus Obscuribacterales bacterium]
MIGWVSFAGFLKIRSLFHYPSLLKFWALLLLLFNTGVAGYLLYLDSQEKLEATKIMREQNAYRSRVILDFNLVRIHHCATSWGMGLAKPVDANMKILAKWQMDELDRLAELSEKSPSGLKYIANLRKTSKELLEQTEKFRLSVPADVKDPKNVVALSKRYTELFFKYYVAAKTPVWGTSMDQTVEYLLKTAAKNNATLINQAQNALLVALIVNIMSLLLVASLPLFVPPLIRSFRDNTSLFQKFCIIVAVPLLGQLAVYAVIAGYTRHVTKQLDQIAAFYQAEDLCRNTHRKIGRLLLDGGDEKSQKQVLAQLSEQKQLNGQNNKYLQRVYDEILHLLPITVKLRPPLDARTLWVTGSSRSLYGDEEFRENCERIMTLNRISYPSIGQDGLLKYRQEALTEQLARIQLIINLSAIAFGAQVVMGVLTLRLFSSAISHRFALVTENMDRYSHSQAFGPPLAGEDEAALLESFLRKTASTIEELALKEKRMIESAGDVIFSISEQLTIKFVNDAAVTAWGWQRHELLDKPFANIICEECREPVRAWFGKLKEPASGTLELRIDKNPEGSLDCLVSAQWSSDTEQYFCVAQDISAQKQIDRLKRDFLAMVSHDLRTPLTASTLFLELLGTGILGELSEAGVSQLRETVSKSGELMTLIKDLLDIERLESERVERTQVELSELKPEILSMVSEPLKLKSMRADFICPQELLVEVNEDRLLQALHNLLLVIISRAKPNSDLLIKLSRNKGFAEIAVDWSDQPNLLSLHEDSFELYKVRSSEAAMSGAGSKLGLPLVRSIIKNHEGNIVLLNQSVERSMCVLQIPLSSESKSLPVGDINK